MRRFVEESQTLARAQAMHHLSGGQDVEGVARGHPLDFVPGADAELIGERLGLLPPTPSDILPVHG